MSGHETVSSMIDRGARIRWECEVRFPGHSGDVNLSAIAQAKGGAFTLANRRPFCRIPGCPGRVRFVDLSSAWPKTLDTFQAWETFDYLDAEKERLEALGYRMVNGHWVVPE